MDGWMDGWMRRRESVRKDIKRREIERQTDRRAFFFLHTTKHELNEIMARMNGRTKE